MKKIDFDNTKPYFIDGDFKWYIDREFQDYIENKQAFNLPKLEGIGCFVVKSETVEDYVLIDNKQNIIEACPYNNQGYDKMETKIKIIKIATHYDQCEKNDV